MARDATQLRREECRQAVRAYLANRPVVAMRVAAITRGLRDEGAFSEDEVEQALAFLASLSPPQVAARSAPLGASQSWQITAAGTLAHERNE